jgi:hypothetical protein
MKTRGWTALGVLMLGAKLGCGLDVDGTGLIEMVADGGPSHPDSSANDGSASADTTIPLGNACMQLSPCCQELKANGTNSSTVLSCVQTAQSGNATNCQSVLAVFRASLMCK